MRSPILCARLARARQVAPLNANAPPAVAFAACAGIPRLVETITLLLGLVGLLSSANGGEPNARPSRVPDAKATAASPPLASFSAPKPLLIKSVFVIPTKPAEGKDPFYPQSTRLFGSTSPKPDSGSSPRFPSDLRLKGISGLPGRRLAIINNRTVAAGEEVEVTTGTGPVRFRCLEVKAESALVRVGSEQRELRLRPGI